MTKYEIIGTLATERKVERICDNICKCSRPEISDLAQIVYEALLRKDEQTIVAAWNEGWLDFYIVRIIRNQWETDHSTFRDLFTKYSRKASGIETARDEAADDWWEKPRRERCAAELPGDKG